MSHTKAWIGVDLDGTLAHYDGWKGELVIGEPIALMADRVKKWIKDGVRVKIMTARVAQSCHTADQIAQATQVIQLWAETHIGVPLEVTAEKDYLMIDLWDDRCHQVLPNTGVCVGEPRRTLSSPSQLELDHLEELYKSIDEMKLTPRGIKRILLSRIEELRMGS